MSKLQPPRGTHDLLPDEARKHRYVLTQSLGVGELFGFEEIATPIFESIDVFKRTLGEASDIVMKEMYVFKDRGGDDFTLRPEGTAGVARAFITHGLQQNLPLKLMYHGPMFRYERPQMGRQRQFHQIGVEFLGVTEAIADVEVIALGWEIFKKLKIEDRVQLEINTLADNESRAKYREALVAYLTSQKARLSADSQNRLERNPLRILDSKDPADREICAHAPRLNDFMDEASKQFYEDVKNGLKALGVPFRENPFLVRGLDYYCHTVFEFKTQDLGAQDAVMSGGRYDQLIEQMGGPKTPGVGWGAGMERLVLLLRENPSAKRPIAILDLVDEAYQPALELAKAVRQNGLPAVFTYSGNISKRMKKANKMQAQFTVVIGEDEVKSGLFTVKHMDSGEQKSLSPADAIKWMADLSK